MQRKIATIGFVLLSLFFPLKASALNYDEIYIFGDSFSDTGNVFNTIDGVVPPSPPYFNGRFSNGPVWVEYLASELELTFNPKNNFAFGGATTGFKNVGLSSLPGLQQQINSFELTNSAANPNALYIVWAGVNNYLDYLVSSDLPSPTQAVTDLSTAVTSLAEFGAKNIMVVNLPNLANFPVARFNFNNQVPELFNNLTNAHNAGLNNQLKLLRQQLSPDLKIISLDVSSLFNRIVATPQEFGLANVTEYCIQNPLVVPFPLTTQPVACNSEEFLFWDSIHPTTATQKIIGEFAFSVLQQESTSIPEPSLTLGVLAFSALGTIVPLKRKSRLLN